MRDGRHLLRDAQGKRQKANFSSQDKTSGGFHIPMILQKTVWGNNYSQGNRI
jgi:hypothetical protein